MTTDERMKIMFWTAGLLFAIGLFARYQRIQFPIKVTSALSKIFLAFSLLLMLLLILSIFGIYLRGYWTTKVILWLFITVSSLFYSMGNKRVVTKPMRIASAITFYFPTISIALFFIPSFLGTILSYAFWIQLTGDPKAIYFEDEDFRIQKVCTYCSAGFSGDPRLL